MVPPGLITRQYLANHLGVTTTEIRRKELAGVIKPVAKNASGWSLYRLSDFPDGGSKRKPKPRNDIGIVAYTADEAMIVFAELRKGTPLVTIVEEKGVHPEVIEGIAKAYTKLTGAMFLSAASVQELNTMPLEATFPLAGEADLMAAIRIATSDASCMLCKKQPRSVCRRCATIGARRPLPPGSERD